MDEDADIAEKINELFGAVAALKAYIAHLPGAADGDLEAVRRAGRDSGAGLMGESIRPRTSTTPWKTFSEWLLSSNPRQSDLHRRFVLGSYSANVFNMTAAYATVAKPLVVGPPKNRCGTVHAAPSSDASRTSCAAARCTPPRHQTPHALPAIGFSGSHHRDRRDPYFRSPPGHPEPVGPPGARSGRSLRGRTQVGHVARNPWTRTLTMMHVSMSDAVNAAQDRYARFTPEIPTDPNASAEAARKSWIFGRSCSRGVQSRQCTLLRPSDFVALDVYVRALGNLCIRSPLRWTVFDCRGASSCDRREGVHGATSRRGNDRSAPASERLESP